MTDPFVGWLSFGVQVALPPGVDRDEFAEELAEFMEFNLGGHDRGGGAVPHRQRRTTPATRRPTGIRR